MADLINAEPPSRNIRAALIAPSIIDTPNNRKAMPDAAYDSWVPPQRIAESIGFLFSEAGSMLHHPVIEIFNRS